MPKPTSVPIKEDAVLMVIGAAADGMLDAWLDIDEEAKMDDGGAAMLTEAELELDACRGADDDGAAWITGVEFELEAC